MPVLRKFVRLRKLVTLYAVLKRSLPLTRAAVSNGFPPLPERPRAVTMSILGSCSRGNEDALHDRAFCVRAGADPGRPGLHPLSRPAARLPTAGPGSDTHRGRPIASESPAA